MIDDEPQRPRPCRAWLGLCLIVALLGSACGGEGESAPVVDVKPQTCPDLDSTLASTLDLIEAGELEPLTVLVTDLGDRQLIGSVMRTVLFLIKELAGEYVNAGALNELRSLVADIEPTLTLAIAPFAEAARAGDTDALLPFDAAAGFINTCPEGALLDAVGVLTSDQALLDSLIALLSSPKLIESLESATGTLGTEQGKRGFLEVIRAIGLALRNTNFDYDALINLVGVLFPLDESPFVEVVDAARPVLTGNNLTLMATAIDCVEAEGRTLSSGQDANGLELVGDALYRLLVAVQGDLGGLVGKLAGLLEGSSGADLLAFVEAFVASLEADDALRQEALTVITFALKADHVDELVLGLDVMLRGGSLLELVEMLGVLADDTCADGAASALSTASWLPIDGEP